MLTDMVTTMTSGFVVCVTQDPVEVSCPCPARSRVQQLCTVWYKATPRPTSSIDTSTFPERKFFESTALFFQINER